MSQLKKRLQQVKDALTSKSKRSEHLRIVKLDPIEDNIIQDTDEDGEETLRLGVSFSGHQMLCRFPVLKNWDNFSLLIAEIFMKLSASADQLRMPASEDMDSVDVEKLLKMANERESVWLALTSAVMRTRFLKDSVQKAFFKYCRPELDGKPVTYRSKRWIINNMSADVAVRMLVAVLSIDGWLKKKSKLILQETFQMLRDPSCSPTSEKKQDGNQKESTTHQYSSSVTF